MAAKNKRDQRIDESGDGEEASETGETGVMVDRPSAEPDVYLDVPQVDVDEIIVDVEDLRARVSLSVEVLDLVRLNVGADVALGTVRLDLKGVHAQALLKVRLDRVAEIVGRVLATVDRNPQVLEQVLSTVERTAEPVAEGGRAAAEAVGSGVGGGVRRAGEGAGETIESAPETAERVAGDGGIGEVHEPDAEEEEHAHERRPQQRTQARKRAAAKKTAKKAAKKAARKRS